MSGDQTPEPVQVDKHQWEELHGSLLVISWFGFQNLLLWSIFFKHRKYGIAVHIFAAGVLGGLFFLGTIVMLVVMDLDEVFQHFLHEGAGFILLLIFPLIMISGGITRLFQLSLFQDPKTVVLLNWIHFIFGWFIIIWSKVTLYSAGTGGGVIAIDAVSHVLFIIARIYKKVKEPDFRMKKKTNQEDLRQIKSEKDLKIYDKKYFIFDDDVYDIAKVLNTHPGGSKIIDHMRGRQVDRFIYGLQSIERFQLGFIKVYNHDLWSMKLAGKPIARISNISVYPNLQRNLNKTVIKNIYTIDAKQEIYVVYLSPDTQADLLQYKGYTQLSQIGQYFSVFIEGKQTRLYTMVNFLQPDNLKIMEKISQGKSSANLKEIVNKHKGKKKAIENGQNPETQNNMSKGPLNEGLVLPLFMKIYQKGHFTKPFLEQVGREVEISHPRGRGMKLQDVPSGRIVILAAGTGFNPFCDLIDLLFKRHLVETNHNQRSKLQSMDPLIGQDVFKNFDFSVYISMENHEYIHPMTIYQMDELQKANKLQVFAMFKEEGSRFRKEFSGAKKVNERFQNLIEGIFREGKNISQFYVCGPTRFTRSILEGFDRVGVDGDLYTII